MSCTDALKMQGSLFCLFATLLLKFHHMVCRSCGRGWQWAGSWWKPSRLPCQQGVWKLLRRRLWGSARAGPRASLPCSAAAALPSPSPQVRLVCLSSPSWAMPASAVLMMVLTLNK